MPNVKHESCEAAQVRRAVITHLLQVPSGDAEDEGRQDHEAGVVEKHPVLPELLRQPRRHATSETRGIASPGALQTPRQQAELRSHSDRLCAEAA